METKRWSDPDDPVEEVYRIRQEIMAQFDGDIDKYNAYLRAKRPAFEAMGAKYVSRRKDRSR
jgi:uncharacterized protein (DUF1330 family)